MIRLRTWFIVGLIFCAVSGGWSQTAGGRVTEAGVVTLSSAAEEEVVAEALVVDSGDTAWILVSAAMVMLMTIGLSLFYGGMVRRKNVLGTIMQSFIALAVITLQWVVIGYSLSFGTDIGGVIGGLDYIGLRGVGPEPHPDFGPTIPHHTFMIFQMMFAIITPALISGAIAERFRFAPYLIFIVLWATLVYNPLAHWVWGGGWIGSLGALDFAGGLVVHVSSGVAALAACLLVGKRKKNGSESMRPHNLTLTLIGAGMLWFGWFGFNGGSALAADGLAASAFAVTHIASAAATLTWTLAEWKHAGKPTALGAASGAIAGLVAITPAAGFVGPLAAIAIGAVAGVVCFIAVNLKNKLGYDDSLDAVGVHGVGGAWGAIATGLFASLAINADGADGLFFGNASLLGVQALTVVAAGVYSFLVTWILLKVLDLTLGLRLPEEQEREGLDLSQHGEMGYTL